MKNKKVLSIKIISGQNLPTPDAAEIIKDIIDPYVQVSIDDFFNIIFETNNLKYFWSSFQNKSILILYKLEDEHPI